MLDQPLPIQPVIGKKAPLLSSGPVFPRKGGICILNISNHLHFIKDSVQDK